MMRRFALMLLFLSLAFAAAGGDIAVFENLGFSEDGRVFLFGQYGVSEESSKPYAEVFAVDVRSNSFVPNGVLDTSDDRPLSLGQDGRGALFALIGEAQELVSRYKIDHLTNGRPIYILVDGDLPRERVSFRDFNTGIRYELVLRQDQRASGELASASFHVELTVTYPDDRSRTFTVGRPGYYRSGVQDYRITQVLLDPEETAVVIVVEKRSPDGSVRYMVETTPVR